MTRRKDTAKHIENTISQKHIPVLLDHVMRVMPPKDGGVYVDGTFGFGGYTRAMLDAANCTVIAIDRDKHVFDLAKEWAGKYGARLTMVHGQFSDIAQILESQNIKSVDGIVVDIGVSSMQIDEAARGFSFRNDGPLDMRMNRDEGDTAADIVNTMDETDLANLIYKYGEERKSRHIAAEIIRTRAGKKFETTKELADAVRRVIPPSYKDKIDPATRTFQALRIAVNDELGELEGLLNAADTILNPDGILAVVTFHSLEDRIMKNFMNDVAKPAPSPSRYMPASNTAQILSFELLTKKPIIAGDDEIEINPRSRSAKLRAIKKTGESA